jgi:hypothetical protein
MAELTDEDQALLIVLSVAVIGLFALLWIFNHRLTAWFILLIGGSFVLALTATFVKVREEPIGSCHYDLYDSIGCPRPDLFCEENFIDFYEDCFAWCNFACPNNPEYSIGPGVCPESGICENGIECEFVNHNYPVCELVVCQQELADYSNGTGELSDTCQEFCIIGQGKGTIECLNWLCQNYDNQDACEEYCDYPENADTLICYNIRCVQNRDDNPDCVCYGEGGLSSEVCKDYCETGNNIETEPICHQWLCDYNDPSNSRCLLPCTDLNENTEGCEYDFLLGKRIYIQNVHNHEYVMTDSTSSNLRMVTRSVRFCVGDQPDSFRGEEFLENGSSFVLFYFWHELPTNRMVGTEFFEVIHQERDEKNDTFYYKFILETTGVEDTYYIKTFESFITAGRERLEPKYLTLGCNGLTLEFHNSIRTLQQWVIREAIDSFNL